jgi:perosamine synthetase
MTDLQAAIGRVQLNRLPAFIERREKWFAMYQESGLDLFDVKALQAQPVRYRIVMRCAQPARVIAALATAGIRAIVPIETHELLDDPTQYPVALALANTTVSLPAHPGLLEADVVRIAQVVKQAS